MKNTRKTRKEHDEVEKTAGKRKKRGFPTQAPSHFPTFYTSFHRPHIYASFLVYPAVTSPSIRRRTSGKNEAGKKPCLPPSTKQTYFRGDGSPIPIDYTQGAPTHNRGL
jgi:hypothetical protein